MKHLKLLWMIPVFFIHFQLRGQSQNFVVNNYTMTIQGGSNMHDWKETVGRITGEGTVTWNSNNTFDIKGLKIFIQVSSIKSSEGSIMNNKTYQALKSDKNPMISFVQTGPITAFPGSGTSQSFSVTGNLTVAGVTRAVTLQGQGKAENKNLVSFSGSQKLKMSDFQISPPRALMGMLKVSDDITIQYSVSLRAATP